MQTPGRHTHHNWPALYAALLLTAGIVPGYRWISPFSTLQPALIVLLCASVCIVLAALLVRKDEPRLLSWCAGILLVVIGVVLGWEGRVAPTVIPSRLIGGPITVTGEVLDQPATVGTSLRFRLGMHLIIRDSTVSHLDAVIMVSMSTRDSSKARIVPAHGQTVALFGTLQPLRGPRNPGEFDAAEYYHANGVDGMLTVRKGWHLRVLQEPADWSFIRAVIIPMRTGLRGHVDAAIGGEEGEFLKGLMIGDRGGLSPRIKDAFLVAGVAHVLAVSGSNVAVVAAALVVGLMLFRIPRPFFPVPVAAGIILYMLISGTQPSVVRATIMALVMLAASHRGWRGNGLNAVGLAALVMYAIDVRQLFDAGFLLSFGAVLSIILLYPRLDEYIGRWKGGGRVGNGARAALRLAAVSGVSALGTLPLTAVQFGRVSVVGLLANIPVVPVTGWSVVLGLCSAALSLVSDWAAGSLAALNGLFLWCTLRFVEFCASVPAASFDTYWFYPLYSFPLLAVLAALYHAQDPGERKTWMLLALTSVVVLVWLPARADQYRRCLKVSFIDVGQGDAALIEHPDGGALLIDTGPLPADVRSGLIPFMLRRGISVLDAVVITHPHDDHAGGLRGVCSTFTVRRILTGKDCRAGETIPWRSDCRLQVLCSVATTDTAVLRRMNANRSSIVLRLVYGRTAFVFAADAELPEEEQMVRAYGHTLHAGLLKVGHHGSAAGTGDDWLGAVSPGIAVISVGRMNKFGHPAHVTLDRLERRGVEIRRTDEEGAVLCVTDGDSIAVIDWQ